MIKQAIIERKSTQVDEGTMGFHDYETVKEDIETFVLESKSMQIELQVK